MVEIESSLPLGGVLQVDDMVAIADIRRRYVASEVWRNAFWRLELRTGRYEMHVSYVGALTL